MSTWTDHWIFEDGDGWYWLEPDNTRHGPFSTRQHAEKVMLAWCDSDANDW